MSTRFEKSSTIHPMQGGANGAPAVEIRDLVHLYHERRALDGVSLQVEQGKVFALLGPNGSGKTTLFKILSTLLRPSGGQARILGYDVVADARTVRHQIGVVFQSPSLDRKLRVDENLRYHGYLYGLRGSELGRRMDEALEAVHLRERSKERVEKLSGGLTRRVEVAKCLIHRPRLLLLDEPSAGLDVPSRTQLREQLRELRDSHGVSSVLTTHLMDEADACDRVAIMDHGKVVVCGIPGELKEALGGEVITFLTEHSQKLAESIQQRFHVEASILDGRVRVQRSEGLEAATQIARAFPELVDRVTVGRPSLEDVFMKFTGHRLEESERTNGAP